jgi:periplasmic divalent cation tolerance protein
MGTHSNLMPAANRTLRVVLVTAPEMKTARRLARLAVEQRLAACANLIGGVESHYWWQEKIETAREVVILFKTSRRLLPVLEKLILQQHPYDTPEFLVLSPNAGTRRYMLWCKRAVRQ